MNISNPYLYITIILVFLINAFGYIYSYLIVTRKIGANKQIQPNTNRDLEYFKNHRSLFLFNVSILILFVFIGLHFFGDYIISFNSELTILDINGSTDPSNEENFEDPNVDDGWYYSFSIYYLVIMENIKV